MRPDQIERLNAIQEKMVEVLISEADPDKWDGAALLQSGLSLSPQERGNRYWEKKNAAMTLALLKDMGTLAENSKAALGRDPYSSEELDKRINKAEADAAKLLEKINSKSRKSMFDKKVHGKT